MNNQLEKEAHFNPTSIDLLEMLIRDILEREYRYLKEPSIEDLEDGYLNNKVKSYNKHHKAFFRGQTIKQRRR